MKPCPTGLNDVSTKVWEVHADLLTLYTRSRRTPAVTPVLTINRSRYSVNGTTVRLFHPEAKVTHEAAIGSVDKKELETLMARGLTPEQAVELIVSGILR